MYFVILGAGEVGVRVAQVLSNEGHEVVLIEKERSRVSSIYNKIDCRLIIDEGTKIDALHDAEVGRADFFIAATNVDETNLIACMLINNIAPNLKKIARIRNKEYIQNAQTMESIFPVDYVVDPEREAALSIIRTIEYGGGASDVFTFKNFGDMMMRNFYLDSDSEIVGATLKDISKLLDLPASLSNSFLFTLINRKDKAFIPTGNFELQEGDEVFVLGRQEELEELFSSYLGKKVKAAGKIRKILIIGASPVAAQILEGYYNTKASGFSTRLGKTRFTARDIIVVEEDVALCKIFAEQYPDVTVLHADVKEEEVLDDLDISQADMLITATGSQERNIVLAAHGHHLGVEHTISLVRNPVYFNVAAELGISMSLSARSAVVSSIINFLRGQTALYSLAEGSYGMFECKVHESSKVVYKPINTISLPPKCLILCINNTQGTFISRGNTTIQPDDTLLCIAHPDYIDRLYKLFGGDDLTLSQVSSQNDTTSDFEER